MEKEIPPQYLKNFDKIVTCFKYFAKMKIYEYCEKDDNFDNSNIEIIIKFSNTLKTTGMCSFGNICINHKRIYNSIENKSVKKFEIFLMKVLLHEFYHCLDHYFKLEKRDYKKLKEKSVLYKKNFNIIVDSQQIDQVEKNIPDIKYYVMKDKKSKEMYHGKNYEGDWLNLNCEICAEEFVMNNFHILKSMVDDLYDNTLMIDFYGRN